jgi:hypothetical protein
MIENEYNINNNEMDIVLDETSVIGIGMSNEGITHIFDIFIHITSLILNYMYICIWLCICLYMFIYVYLHVHSDMVIFNYI